MAPSEDRATISKEQLMKMLADSDENTTSFDFEVARKQVDLSSDEDFKAASVERYKAHTQRSGGVHGLAKIKRNGQESTRG